MVPLNYCLYLNYSAWGAVPLTPSVGNSVSLQAYYRDPQLDARKNTYIYRECELNVCQSSKLMFIFFQIVLFDGQINKTAIDVIVNNLRGEIIFPRKARFSRRRTVCDVGSSGPCGGRCVKLNSTIPCFICPQITSLDVHAMTAKRGKGPMKKCKLSPDGFVQMAMHLAFYRRHKEVAKSYEPSTGRSVSL